MIRPRSPRVMSIDAVPSSSDAPGPLWSRVAWGLLAVGVALRAVQWAAAPSLWYDELLLAENVLEVGLGEILVGGLRELQVAPAGFMVLSKALAWVLPADELTLRIAPFAASLGALVGFALLARRLLPPAGAALAVGAFALNPLLTSLAGALKPYASDVLVAVVLVMAFDRLRARRGTWRHRVALAAGAGALGFFSAPSILLSGPMVAVLLAEAYRRGGSGGDSTLLRAGPALTWGAVALAAALYGRAVIPPDTAEYMHAFWSRWNGFMPPVREYPTWLLDALGSRLLPGLLLLPYLGSDPTGTVVALAVVAAFVTGVARTLRHDPGWVAVLTLPCLGALVAARMEVYPLIPRTSAQLLVPLLLGAGAALGPLGGGADSAGGGARRRFAPWHHAGAVLALAGFAAVLLLRPPPYTVQPIRELMVDLALRRTPGEPLVAHYDAGPALRWYGPALGLDDARLPEAPGTEAFLAEAESLRGVPAVWVLFANQGGEREAILCALGAAGVERERIVRVGERRGVPVSAHRFDLSAGAGASRDPLRVPAGGCPPAPPPSPP